MNIVFKIYIFRAVNSTESNTILDVVRDSIYKFPFSFQNATGQARIITGAEEGTYSWVTSNYVAGKFGEVCVSLGHE